MKRLTRKELEQERVRVCRLDPALALTSLDEAEAFLADRGLLTLTPDSALPSLFGAAHEDPYAPGKRGFGAYPKTKWWWASALGQRTNLVRTRLHRGKTLFLPLETARLADPLCRHALAAATAGAYGSTVRSIVEHLATAGSSLVDDLKEELGLNARELRAARGRLERTGAIVTTEVRLESSSGHVHSSRLARWDQAVVPASNASTEDALLDLVVAGVRAAVIVERAEIAKWFTWPVEQSLIDELLEMGRLVAVNGRAVSTSVGR